MGQSAGHVPDHLA